MAFQKPVERILADIWKGAGDHGYNPVQLDIKGMRKEIHRIQCIMDSMANHDRNLQTDADAGWVYLWKLLDTVRVKLLPIQ